MAALTLITRQQILGDMLRTVIARTGINDVNPGSVLLTLLEAAAQNDEAQYFAILQTILNYNVDTTVGSDLDNRAFEYGLTRLGSSIATGKINILREAGFVKKSTSLYSGFRSRIVGDTVIFVNDASIFPSGTNSLVIGRGTSSEETVTFTLPAVNNVNYWTITLNAPLTLAHNNDSTVVLRQGVDYTIQAGSTIVVPASGRSAAVTFRTINEAVILAGESSIDDVEIRATEPGSIGNVGALAIDGTAALASPPFVGARAQNTSAFTSGRDRESDEELRFRVKAYLQSVSQSTKAGIARAIANLLDVETAKRVVSSNIITPNSVAEPVKIYIDDGSGFEPSFKEQGGEFLVQAATGGESILQLEQFPLVQAQLETELPEPFDLSSNGLSLFVTANGFAETLTFNSVDFAVPTAVTAEQITTLINDRSSLIQARTSQGGKKCTVYSKNEDAEQLQITGGTANLALKFPTSLAETFYLYKNDVKLSKDGVTAMLESGLSAPFNFPNSPATLVIIVDGKTASTQTITINPSDFVSPSERTAASAAKIAILINAKSLGLVALAVGNKIRLTSTTLKSAISGLQVTGGSANALLGFPTNAVVGANQDFTLNSELGVLELAVPLIAGDSVTAATANTRGFVTSTIPENYTFVGGEVLTLSIDGLAIQTITFTAGVGRTASQVVAVINAQLVGGSARIRNATSSNYLEITTNTYAATGSVQISGGTANILFSLPLTIKQSGPAHTAFVTSQLVGGSQYVAGDSLALVMDNDPVQNSYNIPFTYADSVSSGASTSALTIAGASVVFPQTNELIGYALAATSGANTSSGSIASVTLPVAGFSQYNYATPPTNFANFVAGDQVKFGGMSNAQNDGSFLITSRVTLGTVLAAVISSTLSQPPVSPTTGNRYLVASAANTALQPNVISRLRKNPLDVTALTPTTGDRHIVAAQASAVLLAQVQSRATDPSLVTLTHGYRYIIDGVGVGAWAGHNFEIAQYNGVGVPGWIYYSPTALDAVYSIADVKIYQFITSPLGWTRNDWGGSANKIAIWNGSIWTFTNAVDGEVRVNLADSLRYQYSGTSNSWTANAWGSEATKIATWSGSAWSFAAASVNDLVFVTTTSATLQFSGSVWASFVYWVRVSNLFGVGQGAASGTGLLQQRRLINTHVATTGAVTVSTAFSFTPSASETLELSPISRNNILNYLNNLKITSLSTKAVISASANEIQIASKQSGSDGWVHVTGGKVNAALNFPTANFNGLRGYAYYTGLTKLVHKVIYGDERDLAAYPGVGAAGIKFKILAPTKAEIDFSVRVKLVAGTALSTVETVVKSAVTTYVNSLGVGDDVVLASIVERLMVLPQVIDAYVDTPAANVAIADNELARTRSDLITVVGVV